MGVMVVVVDVVLVLDVAAELYVVESPQANSRPGVRTRDKNTDDNTTIRPQTLCATLS